MAKKPGLQSIIIAVCALHCRTAAVGHPVSGVGAEPERLDPAGLAELYAAHGAELRRFLTGVLRDADLAQDVAQTAFAKAMEAAGEIRAESGKAWLFQVAFREALVHKRREGVRRRSFWKLGRGATAAEQLNDGVERQEQVTRVKDALRDLSAEQQEVVRMRIYEDKTFAEIARQTGAPLGTVLSRMQLALKKLRKLLGE